MKTIFIILFGLLTASSFTSCTPDEAVSESEKHYATGDEVDDLAEPDEDN